jgi:hypothetical protein
LIPGQTVLNGVIEDTEEWHGQYGTMVSLILNTDQGKVRVDEKKEKVQDQFDRASITDPIGVFVTLSKKPMTNDPSKGFFNLRKNAAGQAGRIMPPVPAPNTTTSAIRPSVPAPAKPVNQDMSKLPDWLQSDVAEMTAEQAIQKEAEADALWCWKTAKDVMKGAYAVDPNTGEIDPGAIGAVQAMAVGLMIRLEHRRKDKGL